MKHMKSYTQTIIFEISNTANILGSGTLPVLPTPAMIDCFNGKHCYQNAFSVFEIAFSTISSKCAIRLHQSVFLFHFQFRSRNNEVENSASSF